MPKARAVNLEDLSRDQRHLLEAVQKDALTINAEGDMKVGKQVIVRGEQPLVAGMLLLGAKARKPLGKDEREHFVEVAVRIVRKLGVDRE